MDYFYRLFFVITIFYLFGSAWVFYYLRRALPPGKKYTVTFLAVFIFLCSLFLIERAIRFLNLETSSPPIIIIGTLWIAALTYLFFGSIITEISFFFIKKFRPYDQEKNLVFRRKSTMAVIIATAIVIAAGNINTYFPVVHEYDLKIEKKTAIEKLKIVAVSDIHAGVILGKDRVDPIVEEIKALNPDILIIAGDLLDHRLDKVVESRSIESFSTIKTKYGTFLACGNHDYFDDINKTQEYFESLGITVLRDKYIFVDNSFYIIGREDYSVIRRSGKREKLADIMKGVDKSYPVIVIDHQPNSYKDSVEKGADLQLSGHTHNGQLWPFNFATSAIFDISNGYRKIYNTNIIVSSGVGTWGPPVRTTGQPEILLINLDFSK